MIEQHADPGEGWYNRTIVDASGAKVGRIADVYLDRDTRRPRWALVHTGLFGTRRTIVPVTRFSRRGDEVIVPYAKSFVREAPDVDADGELSYAEEATLTEYYRTSAAAPLPRIDKEH